MTSYPAPGLDGKQRKKLSGSGHPLPEDRCSFNSALDIISAYAILYQEREAPINPRDLRPHTDFDPNIISGYNKFFHHLGLIEPSDESSGYVPTDKAIRLDNARRNKDENSVKHILREAVLKTWFWTSTKRYLEINSSITEDKLEKRLGSLCNVDIKNRRTKKQLKKLVEYMTFVELIRDTDKGFVLNQKFPKIRNNTMSDTIKETKAEQDEKNLMDYQVPNTPKISFGILINPETKEEEIRRAIRTIVSELKIMHGEMKNDIKD